MVKPILWAQGMQWGGGQWSLGTFPGPQDGS